MPITRSTDIALRVLITLSAADQQLTVSKLAEKIGVPERYTGKMVQRLAGEGWLETSRGKGGGVRVSPTGRDVTPFDVIKVMGEGWPDIDCTKPWCPLLDINCRLATMLADAEAAFMGSMRSVTMAQLA